MQSNWQKCWRVSGNKSKLRQQREAALGWTLDGNQRPGWGLTEKVCCCWTRLYQCSQNRCWWLRPWSSRQWPWAGEWMCAGSWRHHVELSGNSFTGFLQYAFSSCQFLALSLSCPESKGLTPFGCFTKPGGWEAWTGEWRARRERDNRNFFPFLSAAAQPLWFQMLLDRSSPLRF